MFFNRKDLSYTTAVQKINDAKKLLKTINEKDKSAFLELLDIRINDFEIALRNKARNSVEKEQIIQQYNRFAITLYYCLSRPKHTVSYTLNYHKSNYYGVGVKSPEQIEPVRYNISLSAIILGATLILASIVAFIFNPIAGTILLPIGITLLAPGMGSIFTPDSPDCTAIKMEEKIIFETGAKLIIPSVTYDETQPIDGYVFQV